MSRFGEKVKTAREALQLGQEQLGNLCGVSRRTIVSYETGGKYPRESTLSKLAEALGVTKRYLLNDDCDDPQAGIDEEPFERCTGSYPPEPCHTAQHPGKPVLGICL